jgi:predicted RNA binding protein YcfA (HicA-like mRNA interferase family)
MAVLDAKKTYKNLKSKGFEDANNKSDDHKYLNFVHNDKIILHTKISHGSKDLNDFLIKQMSSQCKLSKEQFKDLANCPLSENEFIQILKDNEIIEED